MAKYFPEPAPFALSEREQEFMDYIARELNRVSQTLLDNADISIDEKFVPPDKPQIGQIVFADGTLWDPGNGMGFYGYNGTTWGKFEDTTVGGSFVLKAGDVMSGDLEINKASATAARFSLVNSNTAAAFVIGSASSATLVFETGDSLFFAKDTRANIDAGTFAATTVMTLDSNGSLTALAGGKYTGIHGAASVIANATGALGMVEIQAPNPPTSAAAFMSFHRPGVFAAYLGIDSDNFWKVGGWSMGANSYKIMHEGLASGTFAGAYAFKQVTSIGATNNATNIIEFGYTGGTNTATGIDFHSSATAVDYDVRFIVSSNAGVTGAGTYTINATGGGIFDGNLNINSATKRFQLQGTDIPFHKAYESAQQTITSAGALTLAHGLGVKPKHIEAAIQCTTAEQNYSIGDEIVIGADDMSLAVAAAGAGISCVPDATNLNIRYGSSASAFHHLNKTTGASANLTNGNWKLVMRAWA